MSRVAKKPIPLPASVNFTLSGQDLTIKGDKGILKFQIHEEVSIDKQDDTLVCFAKKDSIQSKSMAGTTRAIVNNMVLGVTQGFERKLQLVGVGYKAQSKDKVLSLNLGYSHPIEYVFPESISVETPSPTDIVVKGIDKQLVGQVAAEIRDFRRPEPYKGKGVRYSDEIVHRKEAKKK